MRDESVPCVNATLYEVNHNRHMTWNDDRICTVCARTMDIFVSRIARNTQPVEEKV